MASSFSGGSGSIVVFGAANAGMAPLTSMSTTPTPHSCLTTPSVRDLPPAQIHDAQLPSVGCPANSISLLGVKMRNL
jgi:hypothetical protein